MDFWFSRICFKQRINTSNLRMQRSRREYFNSCINIRIMKNRTSRKTWFFTILGIFKFSGFRRLIIFEFRKRIDPRTSTARRCTKTILHLLKFPFYLISKKIPTKIVNFPRKLNRSEKSWFFLITFQFCANGNRSNLGILQMQNSSAEFSPKCIIRDSRFD